MDPFDPLNPNSINNPMNPLNPLNPLSPVSPLNPIYDDPPKKKIEHKSVVIQPSNVQKHEQPEGSYFVVGFVVVCAIVVVISAIVKFVSEIRDNAL